MNNLPGSLLSQLPGVQSPTTIQECQLMWDRIPSHIWTGSDGGFSVPVANGRAVWFFGDSNTYSASMHSMVMVQEDGRMRLVLNQLIPNEGSTVYWPGYVTRVDADTLLVSCLGIEPIQGGWNNRPNRGALLKIDAASGDLSFAGWAKGWPTSGGESWTHPVLSGGDIHFFRDAQNPDNAYQSGIFYTRAPYAKIDDPTAYTPKTQLVAYGVTDGSWSPWRASDGTFRALSLDPSRRDAIIFKADTPAGPWIIETVTKGCAPDPGDDAATYVAHAHPDIRLASGGLACTVSVAKTWGNAYMNRPRFFEAKWSKP